MLTKDDRIVVAVSGCKDNLALWDVLLRLGYQASGLYIDLDISDYSTRSREKCLTFARSIASALIVKDLRSDHGRGALAITELAKVPEARPVLRLWLDDALRDEPSSLRVGFSVLATGHNRR